MQITGVPFTSINWDTVSAEEHPGESGKAFWRVVHCADLRIRVVTYTPGYMADHWCEKGHVIYVVEGEFTTELRDGSRHTSLKGMTYVVSDRTTPHRSYTETGVTLFIVD